jgi:hypothetical protein
LGRSETDICCDDLAQERWERIPIYRD